MTKIYSGIPGTPTVVLVLTEGAAAPLSGGPFCWGKQSDPETAGRAQALARAILKDALGAAGIQKAPRYATRFMWRTIKTWDAAQPFQITADEVLACIRDIEGVEQEMAGKRSGVALETGPRVSDGGRGPGGVPFVWTKHESKQ